MCHAHCGIMKRMARNSGWVGDKFESDTRPFVQPGDLAEYLGIDRETVLNAAKRIGIERRFRSIGASRVLYEPYTHVEAGAILAELRRRQGARLH